MMGGRKNRVIRLSHEAREGHWSSESPPLISDRAGYATVIIDAQTRERIDVLADRIADTLEAWLLAHPGVEVVCRDGSATYAEAIRRAPPAAVQVADR